MKIDDILTLIHLLMGRYVFVIPSLHSNINHFCYDILFTL